MKKLLVCVSLLAFMPGCTDAYQSKLMSVGSNHKVVLYSGGQAVRTWTATGKVQNEADSDGYYFRDKATGQLVTVSGNVVIEQVD